MTPVGNAYISHTDILERNFCHKNVFFLLICLDLHLIGQIRKQTLVRKKNFFSFIHLTLNVFLIFDFITCSQRRREKICNGTCILDRQTSKHSYAYELHHVLLIKHNSDIQIQAGNPQITSSITGKVVLTITSLERLVAMHIIYHKNTGGKTSKIN